ncbi:MAG: hypothetical protein K0Q79_2647 [Flavipsychrobacter sp.]|nr:hypothetical protein [Flavipsychrobacter sp.]
MKKILYLLCSIVLFANLASAQCPTFESRNNGNNLGVCAGSGGSAPAQATNVPGTAFQYSTCCASLTKQGNFTAVYAGTVTPSFEPAVSAIYVGTTLSTAVMGPPTAFTTVGGDRSIDYCFFNVNLPTSGNFTIVYVNPTTGAVYASCTYVGCSGTSCTSAPVTPPTITTQPVGATKCVGESYTWSVAATPTNTANTISYQWSKNGVNIIGATNTTYNISSLVSGDAGTYSVLVVESNGAMTSSNNVTLTVNSSLPSISGGSNVAICIGNSAAITASGGLTYTWSPSSTLSASTGAGVTATPTVTTTYTVTGTNGCSNTATVTVSVNALPTISGGSNVTICSGGSTALTASGGNTYTWTPGSGLSATTGTSVTANPTSTTIYTVTGTNSNGCVNTATVQVSVNPLPTVNSISNVAYCNGATTSAVVFSGPVGGTTFTWANNNTAIGLGAGSGTICGTAAEGGTVVMTAPSGAVFTSVTFASYGTPTGSCGSNAISGCHAAGSLAIVQGYLLGNNSASIPATNAVFGDPCGGTPKQLYVQATYTTSGNLPSFTATNSGGSAITGTVTVTPSANGCTGTPGTFAITVNPTPSISGGSSVAICTGNSTSLTASGGSTYTWTPAAGLSSTTGTSVTASPTVTTTYSVTGTNTAGCPGTATVTVTVNSLPTVSAITGTTTLTLYNTTTLSDATSSGVWSSSATGVATVNSTSGVVTGVSEGTARISYTVTNGFGCINSATTNITVSGYNGVAFDGTNDYMITPDLWSSFSSGSASMTIDLWFKANAAGDVVVEKGPGGVGSGWHDTWIEVLGTGEVKVRVWSLTSVSLGFITFGTWHHAAIRYNATTSKLDGLLDGVASSSSTTGTWSRSGSALFLLFGVNDGTNLGSGAYLNGVVDEIRIWNRALCDGEIVNNMSGKLNGAQTNLVAYYTLDQCISSGTNTGLTTAIDYSGNGRNATLVNSALSGSASNWVTGTVNALAPVYTPSPISAGSNVTICNGSSTTLTALGGTSYRWSPSTGLSATTGSSVTANPTSTITYTVTDVCGSTATVQVSVNSLPTVSGGSSVAICTGLSTGLTANGASAYAWAPAVSLSSSTGANVTATPTVTTVYTVTGTSAIGCSNAATVTVTVTPYSSVHSVTGGGPYCSGTAGATIGLSGSNAGYNYQLIKGGSTQIGSPVAGTGAAISFGAQPLAGLYTVTVTSTAAPGCVNGMSGSTVVSILTSPAPVIMTGGGSVCGGGPGLPIGLAGSAIGIQYQLYRGGSPVGSAVPGAGTSISFGMFTTLGTYTAVATNTVNACTSNMTGSAVINAAAGITSYTVTGTGSYCSGGAGVNVGLSGSTSGISYQLFLGSTAVGSPVIGTGSAISFGLQTTAGTYTVVGTNTSTGCFGTMTGSAVITIDPLPNAYLVTKLVANRSRLSIVFGRIALRQPCCGNRFSAQLWLANSRWYLYYYSNQYNNNMYQFNGRQRNGIN